MRIVVYTFLVLNLSINVAYAMSCYQKTGQLCEVENKEFMGFTERTDCGFTKYPQTCSTGGSETALAIVIDGRIECSGVLISSKIVLTAAHCLNDTPSTYGGDAGPQITDEKRIGVYWGSGIFGGLIEKKKISKVAAIHAFPKYPKSIHDESNFCYGCDIAILVLQTSHSSKPMARLASERDLQEITFSTVFKQVGYGSIDMYRSRDHTLKGVKHFINSHFRKIIKEGEPGKFDKDYIQEIITKSIGDVDTGSGDSGGPLLLEKDGETIVFGILRGGGDNNLSGYTLVLPFAEWIKSLEENGILK